MTSILHQVKLTHKKRAQIGFQAYKKTECQQSDNRLRHSVYDVRIGNGITSLSLRFRRRSSGLSNHMERKINKLIADRRS